MIVPILEKFKNPLVIFGILPLLIYFFTGNILFLLVCIVPLNLLLLLAKFILSKSIIKFKTPSFRWGIKILYLYSLFCFLFIFACFFFILCYTIASYFKENYVFRKL